MDKKLWDLKESHREELKNLTTLQDAIELLNDDEIKAGVNTQILEIVTEMPKEDLEALCDVVQEMRKTGATGYPKYSDLELEKYYNLNVLFTIQEQIDHLEAEEEDGF